MMQGAQADNNCQQYFTGVSGRVKTFNFDDPNMEPQFLISNYDVSICSYLRKTAK